MKLLLVVPCYNEQEVLYDTNVSLSTLLGDLVKDPVSSGLDDYGVLYVDDGSKDETWSKIEKLSESDSRVLGIKLAHNEGHQTALWAGLEYASESNFDAAISIDADLQDDISVIREMIQYFNAGIDIVYGVRKERTTDSWFKRNTAQWFYKLMKSMGGDIVYNHADFRLMSRRSLQALMSYPERNLFLRGLVPTLGYKTDCVYYNRKERMAGESKYPFKKMLNFALDGITSFSVKPLQIITVLGLSMLLVALVAIIYALSSFLTNETISGWTSLIISLWFIGGAILTSLGIIGEYIGKIYREVKRRPRYFIERKVGLSNE
jgi:glycosyltransferase involved in cell wall biosynthesis